MRGPILFVLSILLAGCGSSSSPAVTAEKNLFSSWAQDNSTFVLDISNGSFGTFTFTYLMTGNAICDCTLLVGGTQASGNAVMSGCTYRAGTGTGNPGCSALNASYTFTKPASQLSVCTGGTCTTYH
jgi:hypothetical protein